MGLSSEEWATLRVLERELTRVQMIFNDLNYEQRPYASALMGAMDYFEDRIKEMKGRIK